MGYLRNLWGKLKRLGRNVRWSGPLALVTATLVALAISVVFGFVYQQEPLRIDAESYEVFAGLFVGALAIERLSELLVAPWVTSIGGTSNRVAAIGSAAIVLGTLVSGAVGLRLIDALTEQPIGDVDDFNGKLALTIDIFVTGLAIGGGTKPLHDLLSRLGRRVEQIKDKDESGTKVIEADLLHAGDTPEPIEFVVRPRKQAVPADPSGRAALKAGEGGVDLDVPPPTPANLTAALRTVWPNAKIPTFGPGVPDEFTVRVPSRYRPGTDGYVRKTFSLAHSAVAAGLNVSPKLAELPRAGEPPVDAEIPEGADDHRWSLDQIRLDADTMRVAQGGRGVRVGHLDTGYRLHAYAPTWDIEAGIDLIDDDDDPRDPFDAAGPPVDFELDVDVMRSSGHGTGTASVIAGVGKGELYSEQWWTESETIGVAPEATIVPIRVMRGPVHLFDDDVARGIDHAVAQGCAVISMSLGGYGFLGLEEAIDRAVAAGVIVLAAAGNSVNSVVDPAAYPNVVAVANSGPEGTPNVNDSSSGPAVAVTAPGTDVWRAAFDGETETVARGIGTSYAVAHLAGVAALWLSRHGRDRLIAAYGADQVPRLFAYLTTSTAQPWGEQWADLGWGSGIVDAAALLETPVLGDDGTRLILPEQLAGVFAGDEPESAVNRLTATVASVFTGRATTNVREKIVRFLGTKVGELQNVDDPFQEAGRTGDEPQVPPLVAAEFRYGLARDPDFASPGVLEKKASPELQQLAHEVEPRSDREARAKNLESDWGNGLSGPLQRLLTGNRPARLELRWVGLAALALSVAIAFGVGWRSDADPLGLAGRLTVLGVGLYIAAQAVERLLELVVGPYAFPDRPDRKAERALIMLGVGVVVGTIVSLVTGVYVLESLAVGATDAANGAAAVADGGEMMDVGNAGNESLLRALDVLITGLVIGGGAKPIHDLLERIQLAKDAATTTTSIDTTATTTV